MLSEDHVVGVQFSLYSYRRLADQKESLRSNELLNFNLLNPYIPKIFTDTLMLLTLSPGGPSFPGGPSGPVRPWKYRKYRRAVCFSLCNITTDRSNQAHLCFALFKYTLHICSNGRDVSMESRRSQNVPHTP
ncbi:hypothetical protein GJAV_G00182850 [Gymnothorax javanicus]|nr:hypothetical protein GJAV_G00182850 [Gymnothorax javanicus]